VFGLDWKKEEVITSKQQDPPAPKADPPQTPPPAVQYPPEQKRPPSRTLFSISSVQLIAEPDWNMQSSTLACDPPRRSAPPHLLASLS
jgi:hypothetical protein